MDEFTSAFLSRGKDELKDAEADISYTPFGVDSAKVVGSNNSNSYQFQTPDTEPESVTKWRLEYNANIKKRDATEAKKISGMKESAEKVCDWCLYLIS